MRRVLALVIATLFVVAACGPGGSPAPGTGGPAASSGAGGAAVAAIKAKGKLTCGVKFDVIAFGFRNPTTGQAWSGAVMTLGPQLSIGLIQGANQVGSPVVLPGPPRQPPPLVDVQSTLLDDIP